MDDPFSTRRETPACRHRGPVPVWIPLVVIAIMLVVAGVAASTVPDTRDFAHKHATVLPGMSL
jgi:hypothetical protein